MKLLSSKYNIGKIPVSDSNNFIKNLIKENFIIFKEEKMKNNTIYHCLSPLFPKNSKYGLFEVHFLSGSNGCKVNYLKELDKYAEFGHNKINIYYYQKMK